MTEETLRPVEYPFWILSLPIRIFTAIVILLKPKYDPEKDVCPGCGFRGDSGTAGKTCRIEVTRVMNVEKLALRHKCFRCSAEFYTPVFRKASDWYREPVPQPNIKD